MRKMDILYCYGGTNDELRYFCYWRKNEAELLRAGFLCLVMKNAKLQAQEANALS